MFRVAWLALAVVAAAQEPKRATVHHTATGRPARRLGRTAELSVITDDLHLKLSLEADFGAFHWSYKELSMGKDGTATTRAGARGCHYKGSATDTATGEGGRVTARTCAGYPEAVVRMDGGRVLELAWRDGEHAVFDPSDDARPRTCGVDPERHAPHPPDALRRRHLRGEHDHDDHGHGHDHHDLFQRALGANECAAGPTKYVGIVVFNDEKRYARHGADVEAHTAALFDVMHDIYTEGAPYGLYDGDKLNCRVVPVLIGQVTWRDGNPDCDSCTFDSSGGTYTRSDGSHGMYYARGSTDCASCGDTCTSDEVSATCLLDSLTVYVARERAALESALGVAIDSSILLSGEDFSSTTAGLAWMNGLCVDTWSGSIVEDSGSIAITAATMAHELGHLLGMNHDEGGPNIMQAVMTSDEPHGTGMQFRDQGRLEADTYFTSKYGSSNFWPECLNENVETSWDTPVCGDGIVDIGEQCDPGIFVDDACCTSDCLLEAGCGCANSDACCTDGALTAAGVVCRPAQHDECDEEEVCTGKMRDCPVDRYASPGTDCTEKSSRTTAMRSPTRTASATGASVSRGTATASTRARGVPCTPTGILTLTGVLMRIQYVRIRKWSALRRTSAVVFSAIVILHYQVRLGTARTAARASSAARPPSTSPRASRPARPRRCRRWTCGTACPSRSPCRPEAHLIM